MPFDDERSKEKCWYKIGQGEEASPSKGRHKIRKVIKDKHLAEETKGAAAEERIRRKRMEERQAEYNKIFSLPDQSDSGLKQVKRTTRTFFLQNIQARFAAFILLDKFRWFLRCSNSMLAFRRKMISRRH